MGTTDMAKVVATLTGVAGSPYYITGYFDVSNTAVQAAVDAWATFVVAQTSGNTIGLPTPAVLTVGGDVQMVSPVTGLAVAVMPTTQRVITGTSTANLLSPATQALVRWRTGAFPGGRQVQGHTNLPCQFVSNADQQGRPSSATISAFDSRAAALIANTTAHHVVWSKKAGQWYRSTSGSTWSKFAVLRSRRD